MKHSLTVFFVGLEVQIQKEFNTFFDTLESAVRYAESKKLDFEIIETKKERL